MGQLKVKCPNCGKTIETGISMDEQTFRTATLSNNQVNCPACGQTVTWSKEDVINMP